MLLFFREQVLSDFTCESPYSYFALSIVVIVVDCWEGGGVGVWWEAGGGGVGV